MKIEDIINEKYEYFHSLLPNTDISIYDGYTFEDILSNVLLTAIKKFKAKDIEEEEGFEYIKKTLLTEILFSKKRKVKDKLIFTDKINNYANGDYEN